MTRIITMLGLLLAIFAAVFHIANIAGNVLLLFIIAAIVLVAIGVLTNK